MSVLIFVVMMQALNLPNYPFQFKEEDKKTKIFDEIRGEYLVLTPEEWVRQHLVQYLIGEKHFPKGLIALEKGLKLHGMQKRMDVLVYSRKGEPLLIAECKAPHIKIDQAVFEQIGRYNIRMKLPYLLVSNGLEHYCAKIDFNHSSIEFLKEIPHYEAL
jgi:hypothetical protein